MPSRYRRNRARCGRCALAGCRSGAVSLVGGSTRSAVMPGRSTEWRSPCFSNTCCERRRARVFIQSSQTQYAHSRPRASKCTEASMMRRASSVSFSTGAERNAALNIWNVTPAAAMLTPGSSRTSPGRRLAAITRKDSRRLSATVTKSTAIQYRSPGSLGTQTAQNPISLCE